MMSKLGMWKNRYTITFQGYITGKKLQRQNQEQENQKENRRNWMLIEI